MKWNARCVGTATPHDNEYVSVYEIADENGKFVGSTEHPHHALIAAAPELLEALEDFRECHEEGTLPSKAILEKAEAAIAKATAL